MTELDKLVTDSIYDKAVKSPNRMIRAAGRQIKTLELRLARVVNLERENAAHVIFTCMTLVACKEGVKSAGAWRFNLEPLRYFQIRNRHGNARRALL